MMVVASMYAVITHIIFSTPCISPTIVGSALESTIWDKDANNITIMRVEKSNSMLRFDLDAAVEGCTLSSVMRFLLPFGTFQSLSAALSLGLRKKHPGVE